MTTRFRRPMLMLGVTILIIQAVFMPVGMVYAETTMDTEEQELIELPPMKNYLEEEQISDPRFFFTRSRMQGRVEEPFQVTFFSDQEVSEARVFLPEEAMLLKDQLPTGISVEEGAQPNEWIVQSKRAQNTFVLPLVVEKAGNYQLSVEETMAHLEISDPDNKIVDDYLLSEMESSNCSPQNQENSNMKEENTIRSSELDQMLMVFDGQGNLISGDSNFNYSDIARLRTSADSTVVRESNTLTRVTNVGYFSGKRLDVLISGIAFGRIYLQQDSQGTYLVIITTGFETTTDNYTITAVYTESNEVVDADILFYQQLSGSNISSIDSDSVFRVAVHQNRRNQVSLNNKNIVLTAYAQTWYTGDHIFSNGVSIRNQIGTTTANYILFLNNGPIPNQNFEGKVQINHINIENSQILHTETIAGEIGTSYVATPMDDELYDLISSSDNSSGIFKDEDQIVNFYYQLNKSTPVDPLDPEVEIDPENKPELPEDQGQLSIDFISAFNFGSQVISVHDQTYYAKPQRLLNEDGTVNESEERPNYVQISDRRSENERNGWELAVTQKEQFKNEVNQELFGAKIRLENQQVLTAQGGTIPGLRSDPFDLEPRNRRVLLRAQGTEGTGTWIYRFGDGDTGGESVILTVPKGANPEATTYSTTLIWELSAVPDN